MKFYRLLFILAALYNLAFGLWAGFFPGAFFKWFDLSPLPYPSLWACLGMVVGLYGLLYTYVAYKPGAGDFIIWIGLLGKILGPLGWLDAVRRGELPVRTFPLILCNDLVWWFPFLFYLLRHHRLRGRILTALVVSFHGAACLGLLYFRSQKFNPFLTEQNPQTHAFLWIAVWFLWVLSSLSLAAFLASWILTLRRKKNAGPWIWGALAVCLLGVLCDLRGEWIYLAWLPDGTHSVLELEWATWAYHQWSAGFANGLYCVAGLVLSAISWKLNLFRGFKGLLGFLMWLMGVSLSVAVFAPYPQGVMLAAAATMTLFIPWAAWTGWDFVEK